jgi:hypothetical protein
MMARVLDDFCHFQEADLNENPLLPACSLVARIRWSQNVMEERYSSKQMIFASTLDARYCVLHSLGIYP